MKEVIVPLAAMLCIVILEVMAVLNHIDGAVLSLAVAAVAGLGGYEIKVLRDKVKKPK
ncbi:unnamed protein product [marine sediment metagenome]|uniref:Uncharacterized protein n=1 Tax=marine sediment metagenome TaxID=412755 RepID=X1S6B1_9ZZZZ